MLEGFNHREGMEDFLEDKGPESGPSFFVEGLSKPVTHKSQPS
jgi:hypothetical protein